LFRNMMHARRPDRNTCVKLTFCHRLLSCLVYSFLVAASMAHVEKQSVSMNNTLDAKQSNHETHSLDRTNQPGGNAGSKYRQAQNDNNLFSNPSYCPGGTTSTNNDKCYWDGGSSTSWDVCETYCSGLGRKMVCIDSSATLSFVVNTFSASTIFWIGLNDIATEGDFVWSGGCISSFRKWRINEPTGGGHAENCIASLAGEFIDAPCSTQCRCVCESSMQPTSQPSSQPSAQPNRQPTGQPSAQPSRQPSLQPTRQPTRQPTHQPTRQPTSQPSSQPTRQPTSYPSSQPTSQPSFSPSTQPIGQPSAPPSTQPSAQPSGQPTARPSQYPTSQPTTQPAELPSAQPSTFS